MPASRRQTPSPPGRRWSPSPPGGDPAPSGLLVGTVDPGWRPTPGPHPVGHPHPGGGPGQPGPGLCGHHLRGGAVNGEVPPGPWSPPWPFAGGLGAGVVPPWGVRPRLLPALAKLGGDGEAPPGGGLWIAGGRLSPWRGLPLSDGPADPGRGLSGQFSTKRPPFWGKWLANLGILTGMEALLVLGHALAGAGLLAPLAIAGPELLLAGAGFPVVYLLTRRRRPEGGAGAPRPLTGRGVNPCRVGPGAQGRHRYAVPLGRAQAQPCGWGRGRPRSWVPLQAVGALTHFGAQRPGGAFRRPPFLL